MLLLRDSGSGLPEAGVDEAGRGCLAGPVCAAAVILPPNFDISGLNDSKKLSVAQRRALRDKIMTANATWSIGWATVAEIDQYNILQATYLAMHRAVELLAIKPSMLLVDGNRFKPYSSIPHRCEIKGDARFAHIAAASILAKTFRDELMEQLHAQYPMYGWLSNKGYGSQIHRNALLHHGSSPHHRKSFNVKSKLQTQAQYSLWHEPFTDVAT